ncbi:MAG: M20/M25/M40 family metallo-hydrolase [Tatlockia sp.]|nr:M20/M25/M40 family metallo-hydrolase [Tatlockia sp.]
MHLLQWKTFLIAGLILMNPLLAQATTATEQLQVPQCLANQLDQEYPVLAENTAFKILDLPSAELDKIALKASQVECGHFLNVSHLLTSATTLDAKQKIANKILANSLKKVGAKSAKLYQIMHGEAVEAALEKINSARIWQDLTTLTSYYNRSATEKTGLKTAEWLKTQFENLALASERHDTAAYFVKTRAPYMQPSLVTVIGKDRKEPAIVIGAHMDTLSGFMPGAGDDASGSAIILETARILLASDNHFKRPVYIIWYAAEERGLVGSQAVVSNFLAKGIPVDAVIQFDMAGFRHNEKDSTMWIFQDQTDKALNEFVAALIKTYIKVPVDYSKCGYACSDHASWMAKGIAAAFPVETNFKDHNPYIHTSGDTLGLLNTEHLTNFTKLALAFAIELASS